MFANETVIHQKSSNEQLNFYRFMTGKAHTTKTLRCCDHVKKFTPSLTIMDMVNKKCCKKHERYISLEPAQIIFSESL